MRRVSCTNGIATIVLAVCVAQTAAQSYAQSTYRIADLGALPGGTYSLGFGINNRGQVTGDAGVTSSYGVRTDRAFLYSSGVMKDLGTLPGSKYYTIGRSINAFGEVAGYGDSSSGIHAFLYSSGVMKDLGTPPGGTFSIGYGINTSGQVTGWSGTSDGFVHAFLYSSGAMKDLGTLPGGTFSIGYGINVRGQVTGYSDSSSGTHAFLYSSGVMKDLGTLPGGTFSIGYAINASGQVTGYGDGSSSTHAFLYSSGVMKDLGTPSGGTYSVSVGYGINSSGQVVGAAYNIDSSDGEHAFLYTRANGMVDLNTLIPSDSGWILISATAISDSGQITGWGTNPSGITHAFLLSLGPRK